MHQKWKVELTDSKNNKNCEYLIVLRRYPMDEWLNWIWRDEWISWLYWAVIGLLRNTNNLYVFCFFFFFSFLTRKRKILRIEENHTILHIKVYQLKWRISLLFTLDYQYRYRLWIVVVAHCRQNDSIELYLVEHYLMNLNSKTNRKKI